MIDVPPETPLPADIRRRIARDFSPADAAALLTAIAQQRVADPKLFRDRIVRCIVHVAKGDLSVAERAAALALTDWRDLIVWAEYDNAFGEQRRDLAAPFAEE